MRKAVPEKKGSTNGEWLVPEFFYYGVVILLVLIAYRQVPDFDFTNWDEKRYVFETPLVHRLTIENIKLMFSNKVLNSYNPLVLFSLAVDYSFSGEKASLYHIHNLALHLLNAIILLFIGLRLFKKELAFFVAIVFALHPMHTESVSWIASRKDVLYTFYFLLSFLCYYYYTIRQKNIFLFLSILAFLFSLFSKSQAVVLPLLLLAYDFYREPSSLNWKNQLNKIPFFVLSLLFGYITISGGTGKMTADEFSADFSFYEKLIYSAHAFSLYFIKFFVPVAQVAIYPFTTMPDTPPETLSYVSLLSVPVVFMIAWYTYKNDRLQFFGWIFFLVSIALVLHVVATNSSLIYERFTYVSYIGLSIFSGAILMKYFKFSSSKMLTLTLFLGLAFTWMSFERNKVWENSETLWTDVIEKQPSVSVAYNNRGNVYYLRAEWDKALADFNEAIRLNPKYPNSYSNRGSVYIYKGLYQQSLQDNEKALSISPNFPEAWLGKGVALYNLGRGPEAITCYLKALEKLPNFPNAYNNLGGAYFTLKDYDSSVVYYTKALQLAPGYEEARVNLALALIEKKDFQRAEAELQKVKNDNRALTTLSDLYLKQGLLAYQNKQSDDAIRLYLKSVEINPSNAEAYYNLGGTYLMKQDVQKAREYWTKTLQVKPDHQQANYWLNQLSK